MTGYVYSSSVLLVSLTFATVIFGAHGSVLPKDVDVGIQFDQNYHIHFHKDSTAFVAHVVAKTLGFVGFGISNSSTGEMHNADLFIGGFNASNNANYSGDYYGVGNTAVPDARQNWDLVSVRENSTAGETEIEFRRLYNTGDSQQDVIIGPGEVTLIWSIGATDDINQPHIQRGTEKYTFINSSSQIQISLFVMIIAIIKIMTAMF